jgi:hypothetical protein
MRQEPRQEFPHIEPNGPGDLVAHIHNGLAATEVWRQGSTIPNEAGDARLASLREREQAVIDRAAQVNNIQRLRLGALTQDTAVAKDYQQQLDGALIEYHRGRAAVLGSHVTELAVERPRFTGVRVKLAEMRQAYHESRARNAAARLIRAA